MFDSRSSLRSLTAEELILRLKDASFEEASIYCEELILRFEPLLRRAWRKGGSVGEYQDFAQDVFVRLFGGLPSLRNAKAFPGYFKSIAISVAARYSKKYWQWAERGEEHLHLKAGSAEETLTTGIIVRSYLEYLSPREKEVVDLFFFQGWSVDEISKHLDIEPGAVRATKSRAFKRLRALLLRDAKILSSTE